MDYDPLTPEQMEVLERQRSFYDPYIALNTVLGIVILIGTILGALKYFHVF